MQIITLNMNGIRSSIKKGVFRWLAKQDADIICLQEVRGTELLLKEEAYHLPEYHCYHHSAKKSGYSGVSIFCRKKPEKVIYKLGFELADEEGRYIHAEFGDLIIASLYMPSGTSGEHRQKLKYEFMDHFLDKLKEYLQSKRSYIICGDWNIAHKNIDLKNWKTNQKTSGFLPKERAWLDGVFELGFVDAFRVVNQEPDQYTWWSQRSTSAREKNVGWRIDYQITTPDLRKTIKRAAIYKDENFSDHAPLIMEYDLNPL